MLPVADHVLDGNPWYVQFPRGYWLYEKSKHLWVSGYPLKANLFKSPQEFGLHLLWLLSTSKEYRDCSCVHCNFTATSKHSAALDDLLIVTPSEPTLKTEKAPPKVTPVPIPQIPGQTPSRPSTVEPTPQAQSPLTTARPFQQQLPKATLNPPTSAVATSQPLVTQTQNRSQNQPSPWNLSAPLLFRTGELVWFQNGNTWRLGIVASAQARGYELLPIGHSMVPQSNVAKLDGDMRPFLAFSVPPVSILELQNKHFDNVAWDAMFRATGMDTNKRDLLVLDASKMAAIRIDGSYSMWTPLPEESGGKTTAHYGCFLGAERIEIGDCLRVKDHPDLNASGEPVLLGLRNIFTSVDYPGAVFFGGHLYMAVQPGMRPANLVAEENLPVGLRDENQWRAQINPARPQQWTIIKEKVVLKEDSIRGRWYPVQRLMPILDPVGYQAAVSKKQPETLHAHVNSRMEDAVRRVSRLDTIRHIVPHNARLALEPHIHEESTNT